MTKREGRTLTAVLLLAAGIACLTLHLEGTPPAELAVDPGAGQAAAVIDGPGLLGTSGPGVGEPTSRLPPMLRVRVHCLSGDQPLADAGVRVLDTRSGVLRELGSTGAEGVVEARWPGGPTAVVEASAQGFVTASRELARPQGEATEILLHLEDAHELHGRIHDDLGAPVPNAIIVVRPETGPSARAARSRSAEDGSFVVVGLAAGEHGVTMLRDGGSPAPSLRVSVPLGGPLDLVLPRGAYVFGTVRDAADARPLPSALVSIKDLGFAGETRVRTDEQGAYRLGPFQPGRAPAYLDVTCRGYRPATAGDVRQVEALGPHPSMASRARLDVALGPGGELQLDVELERGAVVSGVVRGPDGPVPDALVMAFPADGTMRVASDAEGRYRIEGLSERAFLIRAHAPGLFQPGVPGDIRAADVATCDAFAVAGILADAQREGVLDVILDRGSVVTIETLDEADGTPVDVLRLQARSARHTSRPHVTSTSMPGRYELSGLAPGDTIALTAVDPAYEQVEAVHHEVGASKEVVVRLRARSRVRIRGEIRSCGAGALEGAYVQAAWLDRTGFALDPVGRWKLWQGAARHPVRADGSYEIELIGAPGRFAVHAVARHHLATTSPDHVVAPGVDEATVDLVLEQGNTLHGGVVDDVTGGPVPGAHVVLTSAGTGSGVGAIAWHSTRATSDARGAFRVDQLPAGPLRVDVRAHGWAEQRLLTELPRAGGLEVRLTPADGVLAGRVEGEAGEAVAAARVVAILPDLPPHRVRSAKDGTFRIDGLVRALATVSASAPGRVAARQGDVAVGREDLRLVLPRGARAAGRVLDPERRPVPRVWLRFAPEHREGIAVWVRVDASGRFDRSDLLPGRHTVSLRKDDGDVPLGVVELPATDLLLQE